jgi:adenine phosphoribosyltransferase
MEVLAQSFDYTHILGIESRGFIFGSALAHQAHKGLALARKPNKLPLATHKEVYGLEYGSDSLEIQQSSLPNNAKVLLIDDVLATGGTLIAADKLLRSAGFDVCGAVTLLEISFLNGKELLDRHGIANQSVLVS